MELFYCYAYGRLSKEDGDKIESDSIKNQRDLIHSYIGQHQALENPCYTDWHQAYVAVDFARMPAYRGQDKDTAEWVKNLRNEAKAAIGKLGEAYFCYGAETQTKLISSLYPIAKALSETVIHFAEAFAQAKKEKLWLDFNDYEHFALQILTEPGSTKDNIIPTDAAKQMQQKYDEIMIDEYQDSNVVQEMLLTAVSAFGGLCCTAQSARMLSVIGLSVKSYIGAKISITAIAVIMTLCYIL